MPSSGDLPNPGMEPRSPALQADSLPYLYGIYIIDMPYLAFPELPGNPVNTGVGSLSLLQRIFPAQESNQGLLHCRWVFF